MNPSYFLIFFEIVTGISKTPGTVIVFIEYFVDNVDLEDFNNEDERIGGGSN